MNLDTLKTALINDEWLRLKPYRDTVGKLTIGVGRNLDDVGIFRDEAMTMLDNDINRTVVDLQAHLPVFATLNDVRQNAIINMAFNLGIGGLLKFHHMITAMEAGDFDQASAQGLDSAWAKEVGDRATRLMEELKNG